MGYKPVPLDIDFQGTRPDDLRNVLINWNESARGMPRPHVLYQVPVGQNPTGMTMSARRKKEIYDICVEFDVIIVEDDPYYFLQEGPYVPKPQRGQDSTLTTEQYLASLTPTFLRFDYQGRVIRLDSFSKTIAPGSRLGWFTCNPLFAERMERQIEVSTQSPCGFSQSLIIALLNKWGYNGWVRWLQSLGSQYRERRDFFVDCMHEEFSLQQSYTEKGVWNGTPVYLASSRQSSSDTPYLGEKSSGYGKVLFSMVPPTSGMFVWLKVDFQSHPRFSAENVKSLELKLWTDLAEAGLLIAPGWMFNATGADLPHEGHYRISFSAASHEEMRKGLQIFGHVTRRFFQ
jgi:aromatic amino acid aminotransferase I